MEMDIEWTDSRRERSDEIRDQGDSLMRERWEGGHDDPEEIQGEKSKEFSKHRSKDRSKSSRRGEKDYRNGDREISKASDSSKERDKEVKESEKERVSSRDRRKEDRDEREKDRTRDKAREKDADWDKYKGKDRERDGDHKNRGKEKEHEKGREIEKDSERARDKERGKEKSRDREKDREKEKDRLKDREREKEKEKYRDREKEKEIDRDRDRERENDKDRDRDASEKEKGRDRTRDKERETGQNKERYREKEKVSQKRRDDGHDRTKDLGEDDKLNLGDEDGRSRDLSKEVVGLRLNEDDMGLIRHEPNEGETGGSNQSASELEVRISKMKQERLKKKSDDVSEILSWVNISRKLEEKKNSEKEKALQLSKIFEEQDNINQGDSEDESEAQHATYDLEGVKVLHGLDKVVEGGAVVLTLKDQSILADGDINQEVDMLENVEIGEQKRRDEAYKAAKKKTGIYDDKFNDEPGSEKKMLPLYDDPIVDEGVTLDARGRLTGQAERKLEELRRRIQGASTNTNFEDLNSAGKISSDYYTHEEMLQFKKPKKKKSLRKKDKLDLDALETEARSAGLGVGDLGSRKDHKMQVLREEQERFEAAMRSNAYQSAYARASEASKVLQMEQTLTVQMEEEDTPAFGDDDEDLHKSLERARKLALKKQDETAISGPQAVALLASSTNNTSIADNQNSVSGESHENKVVFTEMEEFVWGLQHDEETHKPRGEDVFNDEDVESEVSDKETMDIDSGGTGLKNIDKDEGPANDNQPTTVLDETIHEVAVGKGLSGALKLLHDRGTLKESVEWGGRNMDKKKGKLVGINDEETKEIRIERTDEYGRILTPKEAFRLLSHKFHGKGPGKMKQEKRMRQFQEELKVKQMKNADTPSLSAERMREAQAKLKTPYLVLSGHVKPGQTSDPRSGLATIEKDLSGGLTPMLGDRKVEHFLGIKRKSEPGDNVSLKKPKT